ncbi:hypothetical protein F5Y18DRAFT_424903 [Xylariaceae sp. FL1019]|nr:hypothetical protein F5Y18DRAFT_424903 [Xylariaceae sp. FL1019]
MGQETVSVLIAALIATFAAGEAHYTAWLQRQWQRNHYRKRGSSEPTKSGNGMSAASTLLRISAERVKDAYDCGVGLLGEQFAVGDAVTCHVVREGLESLKACIGAFERATSMDDVPLDLTGVLRVSTAVQQSVVAALHKQYKRVAISRLVPRGLKKKHDFVDPVNEHVETSLQEETGAPKIGDHAEQKSNTALPHIKPLPALNFDYSSPDGIHSSYPTTAAEDPQWNAEPDHFHTDHA